MARLEDDDRRDAAGVGPYARSIGALRPLRELDDWDITDGSADIRGWQVVTLGGRELGRVDDLLVDIEEHEVVLFTVDLKDSDRTATAPLRAAQIERDQHMVRIDSADLEGVVATDMVHDRDRDDVERDRAAREPLAADADPERHESLLDRIKVHHREKEVEHHADRDADRVAADAPVERVVERRPVVVEEVVVRRRTVDPQSGETLRDEEQRAASSDAELHRDKPGETF